MQGTDSHSLRKVPMEHDRHVAGQSLQKQPVCPSFEGRKQKSPREGQAGVTERDRAPWESPCKVQHTHMPGGGSWNEIPKRSLCSRLSLFACRGKKVCLPCLFAFCWLKL